MRSPLVAQLAHVELLVPDAAGAIGALVGAHALAFAAAHAGSAFLRGSEDWLRYSLKVTDAAALGVGHVAWRTSSAETLRQAVAALAASGRGLGWTAGDVGHGPSYRFQGPSGHVHEVLWEAEGAPADGPGRPTALAGLDHVTLTGPSAPERDAAFFADVLGFRRVPGPPADERTGVRLAATGGGFDLEVVAAAPGCARGLHHVGMRRSDVARAPGVSALAPALAALGIAAADGRAATVSPAFPAPTA
jgi:catechol 2,3-dioxygenase